MIDVDAHDMAFPIEVQDDTVGDFFRFDSRRFAEIDVERVGLRVVVEFHCRMPFSLETARSRKALWSVLQSSSVTTLSALFPNSGRRAQSGSSIWLNPRRAPPDYPRPGQHVRWRCNGLFRILHDRPQAVEHAGRLRSILDFGPYHMDETYTLTDKAPGCRLDLHMELTVRIPILGSLVERVYATRSICKGFETSLQALKLHCEAG